MLYSCLDLEREGEDWSVLAAHTNRRPLITICGESEVITAGPAGIIIVSTVRPCQVRTDQTQYIQHVTPAILSTNTMAGPGGINREINYVFKLFWAQTGLELELRDVL